MSEKCGATVSRMLLLHITSTFMSVY